MDVTEAIGFAGFTAAGFAAGGVMFSYLVPKIFLKKNIVSLSADGNPGMTNVIKLCGVPLGLFCLLLDMLKGFLPVFLAARFLNADSLFFAAVLAAPVIGHAVAPFNRFKGGKCVAVSFGALLGLIPGSFAALLLAFTYIFFSTAVKINPHEKRSCVSFVVFSALTVVTCFFTGNFSVMLGGIIITVVASYRNGLPAFLGFKPSADADKKEA